MKLIALAASALLSLSASAFHLLQEPESEPPSLESVAWLEGAWEVGSGERITREQWLPAAGSTMFGVSHSWAGDKTRFFEFLRIERRKEGLVYIAQPRGTPPVEFALVEGAEGKVVFENPKHDHPQRIRYEKTAEGVTATVELLDGSKAHSFDFKKR